MKTWQEYVASGYSLHYVGGSGKSGKYSSFGIANKYEYGKRFFLMVPVNDSVQKEKESEQYFLNHPKGHLFENFSKKRG